MTKEKTNRQIKGRIEKIINKTKRSKKEMDLKKGRNERKTDKI